MMKNFPTLRLRWTDLLSRFRRNEAQEPNSRRFAEKVYRETGVTPGLRRVYERYLMNEERRKSAVKKLEQETRQ